jgi:hypothetical protein
MVEKTTASCNPRAGIALVAPGQCAKADRHGRLEGGHAPTEREMKLTQLFSRARQRAHYHNESQAPARHGGRVGNHPGNDVVDRSSMADLVRLLKEADDAQRGDGRQLA